MVRQSFLGVASSVLVVLVLPSSVPLVKVTLPLSGSAMVRGRGAGFPVVAPPAVEKGIRSGRLAGFGDIVAAPPSVGHGVAVGKSRLTTTVGVDFGLKKSRTRSPNRLLPGKAGKPRCTGTGISISLNVGVLDGTPATVIPFRL